jgi:hypothetical protein
MIYSACLDLNFPASLVVMNFILNTINVKHN